jgi:hypothetical protein
VVELRNVPAAHGCVEKAVDVVGRVTAAPLITEREASIESWRVAVSCDAKYDALLSVVNMAAAAALSVDVTATVRPVEIRSIRIADRGMGLLIVTEEPDKLSKLASACLSTLY